MTEITISGLPETESVIYNTVLRGGKMTLMAIAHNAKLNRTTLYPYIKNLLQKELIAQTIIGKRTYYTAENPQKILKRLDKDRVQFEESLPHLLDIYNRARHKPNITTYEGPGGIYRVFRDAYEEGHYVKTFYSPGKFQQVLSMEKEGKKLFEIIQRREVKAQGLSSNTPEGRTFMKDHHGKGFEMKMMPADITFPVEFMLYNQRVIIVSFEHMFAVVIESADIKEFLEKLFDYFWKIAK